MTGIQMTHETRFAKTTIEDMHDEKTVKGWLSLALTDANKAMVQSFADTVKLAHVNYNAIAKDDAQLKLLGEKNKTKLFAVEEALREVKKYFGIQVKMTSAECAETSTHRAQYAVGETFDMTGLLVTIIYDDFSTEIVDASKLTLKNQAPLTKLDNYVEVEYTDGKTTETAYVMITVLDELPVVDDGIDGAGTDASSLGLVIGVIAITLIVVGCVAWDFISRRRKVAQTDTKTTEEVVNEQSANEEDTNSQE